MDQNKQSLRLGLKQSLPVSQNSTGNLMEKIVALCKRRGFIYPGSEIYGGLSNSWDYGPVGVELKNNIKQLWWKRFVNSRDDIVGIDASLIMNPKVWEASGHLENFSDPLVECKKCHKRFRADQLEEALKEYDKHLPKTSVGNISLDKHYLNILLCNEGMHKQSDFTEPKNFNLMFKTFIGPAEEQANMAYFRPETAQAMFVNFKNVMDSTRVKFPFGIAQTGKAFRNEITPGNFIFRTREFEQMEIEYFFSPPKEEKDWQDVFESWRKEMVSWMESDLGLDMTKVSEYEVPDKDRAHYSKRTIDFMYSFPFGESELYGLAYRTDFDLKNHQEFSGQNLKYRDPQTNEEFWPHVVEPTWGVDRSVLAVLLDSYKEEEGRVFLKLKPSIAPYKAAIFPLLHNKPELIDKAREIYKTLKKDYAVAWDDRGNIGKRYASQDEIGTPYCITVDFDTLKDDAVTVRDRDTAKQERVKISELAGFLGQKIS